MHCPTLSSPGQGAFFERLLIEGRFRRSALMFSVTPPVLNFGNDAIVACAAEYGTGGAAGALEDGIATEELDQASDLPVIDDGVVRAGSSALDVADDRRLGAQRARRGFRRRAGNERRFRLHGLGCRAAGHVPPPQGARLRHAL